MVDDRNKGTSRHYNSGIDQHLEVAVEEAEKSLLQGRFRQALKDANRCLLFAADGSSHPNAGGRSDGSGKGRVKGPLGPDDGDTDFFCVRAPLYFPFVFDQEEDRSQQEQQQHQGPTTVCIRIEAKPSDVVDRAAAVALQSWYEVSRRISDAPVVQESHLRLLQPFWRVYATACDEREGAGARSCSLELIVVLVQFCRAAFHVREAVELALAALHHVLSSEEAHSIPAQEWQHVDELLAYLLCDLLPRTVDERAVDLALIRLSGPGSCYADRDGDDGGTQREQADDTTGSNNNNNNWTLSDQTNARVIKILVRFLENPPLHWPEECQGPLEACRERLDAELQKHPPEDEESSTMSHAPAGLSVALAHVPVNGVRDASSGRFEGLPTLGWDAGSYRLWLFRLAHLTKVSVVEPLALSRNRWSNRGILAVSVWAFWMAWRQRGKFYRSSKRALCAALRDIIDSITSPSKRS